MLLQWPHGSFFMEKILIIQTAFIGDVILATALVEQLHGQFPGAAIDFLLRKGNERLFDHHPFLNRVLIWDKKSRKYLNLLKTLGVIRRRKYDLVVNLQRFFSTGFLTAFSGAEYTVGFKKNPLSFLFSQRFEHKFGTPLKPIHEVGRNLALVEKWTGKSFTRPKLYPVEKDYQKISPAGKYITVSPASVWFTKQWPADKWIQFLNRLEQEWHVFLLGSKSDVSLCETIRAKSTHPNIQVLAGQLSFLESAALMQRASMNFTNDSAPLHLASAVNAPVTAIYCSTIPAFGFTPLSDVSHVIETNLELDCRPCSLHGLKSCPRGHFNCARIEIEQLLAKLP